MMTTIHTPQMMVAEFKEGLNARYVDMVKHSRIKSDNNINSAVFFKKMIMQHLDGLKITKKFNDKYYRARKVYEAADFAERCCAAPNRRANAEMYIA